MNSHQMMPDEVNIGDIIRLALPLKTAMLTAAAGTRRAVKWVVLLTTWRDLRDQVRTDDLVMLPPALQQQTGEAVLLEKIEALSAESVSGLILFDEVSDQIGERAREFELPLMLLPTGISVRETHRSIVALLVDRQSATSERGMQLYRRLSEMSREGQGLAAMTDVMSKLTGKIIVVQDKRLEIQATSLPRGCGITSETLNQVISGRDQLPAVLRNRKAAAKARQTYWQQLLPIENMGRLISPIISGDRARGYLSVVGPADELDLLDSLTAEHGAAACALEMAKAKAVSEAKKALRGDFLEGVLAGTLPQHEVERLAGRLDHDTEPPHAVLTFAWDNSGMPSLRRLETTVNWLLADHTRPALVHAHGDQHLCIFQALKSVDDMESAHELARRLQEQIKAEFPNARLIGGISGPASTLAEWPAVCQEAIQSMELGQRLRLNQIVEFKSLGVYRLLGQLEDIGEVRAFTKRVIGPLVTYDRQHRSSLVQTIDAYFKHHGNISQTAESLFIHRNTLLYRLERIQELTRQDLNQSNMRLALHLALRFWQLQPNR
jgi:purine catabolism regulator